MRDVTITGHKLLYVRCGAFTPAHPAHSKGNSGVV